MRKASTFLKTYFRKQYMENWKTAVSTTDWMVETKLCKMRDIWDTFVGRAYSSLYRGKPWHRAKSFVGVTFSRSPAFTRNVFDLQVLPALLKTEFWLAFWLAKLIRLANSAVTAADTEIWERATQKPAAAEGKTTRVRRHIRGVVSEITVRCLLYTSPSPRD